MKLFEALNVNNVTTAIEWIEDARPQRSPQSCSGSFEFHSLMEEKPSWTVNYYRLHRYIDVAFNFKKIQMLHILSDDLNL